MAAMLLDELTSVIDKICETDPAAFADIDAIKVLRRQRHAVRCVARAHPHSLPSAG
jgi:hypothetical protein